MYPPARQLFVIVPVIFVIVLNFNGFGVNGEDLGDIDRRTTDRHLCGSAEVGEDGFGILLLDTCETQVALQDEISEVGIDALVDVVDEGFPTDASEIRGLGQELVSFHAL